MSGSPTTLCSINLAPPAFGLGLIAAPDTDCAPYRRATGLLNLMYDAMPADYVTLIATEFGAIPPTSVPVILREYRQEPAP